MRYYLDHSTALKTSNHVIVYRVKYFVDIPEYGIKARDVGGWVSSQKVLPQDGTGVILGDAVVTGGTIYGGVVRGGEIDGGIINGGEINGGEINGGEINGGTINGGVINGGEINGGVINGGIINNGEINGGEINGGTIYDGVLYDGVWHIAPLLLDTPRYSVCVCGHDRLQIGCINETFAYWEDHAAEVGKKFGLPTSEIKMYVRLAKIAKTWCDKMEQAGLLREK
jgi:hypothetical protein